MSVVSVELSPAGGLGAPADPEDLVELVGAGLAEAISEAELLGGTVASVSGSGMSVLFGAPQAHEDDPERALRSALRISAAVGRTPGSSGKAAPQRRRSPHRDIRGGAVGPHRGRDGPGGGGADRRRRQGGLRGGGRRRRRRRHPGIGGQAGSVLVGPATRAATEGIFEWGPSEDVVVTPGAKPLAATYLVGPRPRSAAETGRRRLAAKAPLVRPGGRAGGGLRQAVQATVAGRGGAVLVVG